VMAALQLAHELLLAQEPDSGTSSADVLARIQKMRTDLDAELARQQPLF